jgi:membrane-bound lytic murein transglycosylase F
MRLINKILLIVLLLTPCQTHAFDRYNRVKKYDKYFSKYSKRYFGPAFDWRYFKAQAVAESRLKAEAKSKVGAVGIMQIMPKTFEEITGKDPSIKGNRKQPRWSIAAGIYYDRIIWKAWKAKRPFQDRLNFMFGSYNAGKRNILKAQNIADKQGLDPNLWPSIERTLPEVTRRRSKETLGYVKKISHIKGVLK